MYICIYFLTFCFTIGCLCAILWKAKSFFSLSEKGRDRILAPLDLRVVRDEQCCSFSRSANGCCSGALITTKYGPISPPGASGVGSFRGFQPAGILSEEHDTPLVRAHLSFTNRSAAHQ